MQCLTPQSWFDRTGVNLTECAYPSISGSPSQQSDEHDDLIRYRSILSNFAGYVRKNVTGDRHEAGHGGGDSLDPASILRERM